MTVRVCTNICLIIHIIVLLDYNAEYYKFLRFHIFLKNRASVNCTKMGHPLRLRKMKPSKLGKFPALHLSWALYAQYQLKKYLSVLLLVQISEYPSAMKQYVKSLQIKHWSILVWKFPTWLYGYAKVFQYFTSSLYRFLFRYIEMSSYLYC